MRHSIKRVSKSALSVILALMMVVSTMVVGMVSTANAATITAWTIAGYPINSWNYSAKQITGSSGSWIFDRGESVSGTTTLYFRIRCHESSNTYNYSISSSGGLLNKDTTYDLSYNTDGEMSVSVSQRYVRFTIDQAADSQTNRIKVEESATSDFGSSGETTTNLATSTNTLLVAYDKSTENKWNYTHIWYSGDSNPIYGNSTLKTTNISGLTYYDFKDITLTADKQINFIVKNGDQWSTNNSGNIENPAFVKGVQWYAYNNGTNTSGNPSNAQYTPLAIKSLSTKEVTSGQDNTITFTPAGGVPYFLSDKGASANYTLNVSDTSGTKIVDNASIANDGTYDVTWNPSSTSDDKLTFVLSDGIDSVSYTADFTVSAPVTSYTVLYGSNNSEFGSITAAAGGSPIGSTVTAGTEVTFTATPNGGYEVEGWYSNAGCTDKIAGTSTANVYKVTVNSDTTVYVKFKDSTSGTANFHGGDVLYLNTGAWKSGEAFFAVKCINGSTATWARMDEVTGEDGLYKVTLPGDSSTAYTDLKFGRMNNDYSSTAEADLKDDYVWNYQETTSVGYPTDGQNCLKVNAANGQNNWDNNAEWTTYSTKTPVDAPEIEVDSTVIADTVDAYVTLRVKNYDTLNTKYTEGLDFVLYKNGAAVANLTSATYQIKEKGTYKVQAVPHNTTDYSESAFSNEVEVTKAGTGYEYYIIIQDNTIAMTPSATESNVLYSTTTLGNGYWFKIARTKDGTTGYSKSSAGDRSAESINVGDTKIINDWTSDATSYNNAYMQNGGAAYYIKFNTATGEISLSSTTDGKVSINVYAKDGTTIDGGTKQLGETSVTAGASQILAKEDYIVYSAQADSYLTIRTKMDSTAVTNGFYVYGFCINGVYYKAEAKINDIYETSYQVTGNEKNGIVEITPVYYNKNIEEANEYITVYADASQLGDHWGNTISCYSYYYKSTSGTDAFETTPYPGQPMLLGTNGLYYTRVPRYYYSNGQKILDSNNNPYTISGVTLNSFTEKETHGTLYPEIGKNYQTYDYDDFKYIADLGYDTVKFVVQYRDDKVSYQSKLLGGKNNAQDMSTSKLNINDYNSTHGGWNDLLNYDDEQIDLIGNVLTAEQKSNSPLYVVSVGNQKTSMGEYSTVWYVYDSQGQYVTQGIPSDFIERKVSANNKDNYNVINSNSAYKNHPVKITYESEMNASTSVQPSNSGVRIDGRWLYTKSTAQQIPVYLTVQYYDGTDWVTDTTATAGTAKIDDISTENGVATKTFTERNVNAAISATAKSGYVFVEWGTVDENGTYTKLSNIKSASAEFMVDKSYNIVARFEKVEDGSLTISHEKYAGPDALGGGGYYKISADVVNASDSVITSYPISESPITISNLADLKDNNYKIKITLTTTMKGDNEFADWYMLTPDGDYSNITQSAEVWGAKGEVSQTITVDVVDLYDENGANIVVSTLQYYSDIAPVTKNAILYYKYLNRFGEERTYTKVVELTEKYNYQITDDLIYDNAPAVEDLHKDCTWTITEKTVTRQGTTATLWGTHKDAKKRVHLSYGNLSTSDAIPNVDKEVTYNEYLKTTGTDEFYRAPAQGLDSENNQAPFAYWIVKEEGTEKEVARCYSRDFNLRIVDHYDVTAIYSNDKEDVVTISDPKFTREQFTDSSGNIKTDYLYADFIVAYMGTDNILLNSDAGKNYHTGLIVEYGKDNKITVDSENDDKVGSTYNGTLTEYTGFTYDQIKAIATDSETKHESITITTVADGSMYAAHKFVIDNRKYNNFNRLDYYVQFNNNKNIRHYIMKAYYYVYQTDNDGKVIEGTYKVTEPVYFCYYNIGNSATKTETSNV